MRGECRPGWKAAPSSTWYGNCKRCSARSASVSDHAARILARTLLYARTWAAPCHARNAMGAT